MVIKLVKTTATFQVASLSGSVVVVTKPKNLIFSLGGASRILRIALPLEPINKYRIWNILTAY